MSRKPQSAGRSAAVLPEASRERLGPWLARAGYAVRPLSASPAVAVVDLTAPEGPGALAALRHEAARSELPVLAVVGDSHEDAARALTDGADGFVAQSALEREFDLRLEAVRRLAVARAEQARRAQDLAVLLELTAQYASALDVATLLHDATRRLAEELSVDRCALVLVDGERSVGHIVAASDDSTVHDVCIELSRYPEIREALRTGQPVVVDDVGSHPLLGEVKEAVSRRGIAALAAVPLSVQNKVLGVLLLRASEGCSFTPQEVSFAWTVAHATAIALRNARMVEGLRGQAEKAEAQVAELARYEEFFQYVSDGFAILDEQGAVVCLNPAGAHILGLDPDRARGKLFVGLATAISEPAMMEMFSCVRRGLVCRNVDLEVRTPDERQLVLSVCASSAPGGAGILVSFRDVTEARALERELRRTRDFMEKLIDSSVDAIVAADLDGRVLVYNQSAERIFGHGRVEALGMDLANLFPDGLGARVLELIAAQDAEGAGRLEPMRCEVLARDGERVPVLLSAALIHEGEAPAALVGVLRDLRERNRLEAKLTRAEERLVEAEKQAAIVELAGTAAHELNQPLTSVMGYAELLKRRLREDDPAYRPVDIIYREAERMAEIVRKIGKITRYETKAYVGGRRIVDLDRAAGDEE